MHRKIAFSIWVLIIPAILFSAPPPQQKPQPNFFKSGVEHFNKQEFDAAMTDFQKAVKATPARQEAHYYLGATLMKKNSFADAVPHLTRAIELNKTDAAKPPYWQALLARGECYIALKQYDPAIADLTVVTTTQPGNAEAQYQLGLAYSWQARYQDAINAFDRAIQIDPNNAYAHYWDGLAYYKIKNWDQMVSHFQTFLRLAPDAPEAAQVKQLMAQFGR